MRMLSFASVALCAAIVGTTASYAATESPPPAITGINQAAAACSKQGWTSSDLSKDLSVWCVLKTLGTGREASPGPNK